MNRRVSNATTAVVVLCALAPIGPRPSHAQCVLNEIAKCAPDDGFFITGFGEAVAISGDTAIVGARWDDEAGEEAGAAYIYRADGNSWVQQLKLIASDAHDGQTFGEAVAIDGDLAVVGAPDTGDLPRRGAAHLYRFNGTTWIEEAILTPGDPLTGALFGSSVAVEGDVVLAGRLWSEGFIGAVYIFRRTAGVWAQEQKITPDVPVENGLFGTSVSLVGNDALIGANHRVGGDAVQGPGAAYVFRFNGNDWLQAQMLTATAPADQDGFGTSVCARGDQAIVGAYFGGAATPHVGSAFVFRRDSGVWVQEDELVPSDGEVDDRFGWSTAISGDAAVIGAPGDDEQGLGSGSAYLFHRAGTSWVESAKLLGSDIDQYESFGRAISLDGNKALVGATPSPSAAYVFDGLGDADGDGVVDACECDWDLNGDSTVNVVDFLDLLAAWGTDPGGPPDFDGNGNVDVVDFLQMLAHWGPCP
ncbi:MAG: hypothetical protein ACYSUF_06320 [Planctomycetota bacterium]|jgi:hypothetical protein